LAYISISSGRQGRRPYRSSEIEVRANKSTFSATAINFLLNSHEVMN